MTEPNKPPSDPPPDYYEFKYPHVMPQNEALNILSPAILSTLTPLECAFVVWMLETGNAEMAVTRLIHPAVYFDVVNYGAKALMRRPHVKDTLRRIKQECPYLRLYSLDYIAGVIHDEVQYLRRNSREARFYGDDADLTRFNGKQSIHQEELAEIAMLRDYLGMLVKMNEAVSGNDPSDTASGSKSSSIDRVLSEASRAINEREARANGEVREPPTGTP